MAPDSITFTVPSVASPTFRGRVINECGMYYDRDERIKELEAIIKSLKQELHHKNIEIQQYRRHRFK